MSITIQDIIGAIFLTIVDFYVWIKFLGKKPNFKLIRTYIIFIILVFFMIINYFYNNQFIKIVTMTIVISIFIKFLFNEKIGKSIIVSVLTQLLYMVAEIIFSCALIYIFKKNPKDFTTIYFGTILTNVIISVIVVFLIQISLFKKLYLLLLSVTSKIKNTALIVLLLHSLRYYLL